MAASTTFQILKKLAPDMIDNNGNFRTIPIGEIKKRNLSDSRITLLKSLYTLLMDEGFTSKETRLYIFDPYITMSGVNNTINRLLQESKSWDGKEIPINNTYYKIQYDREKIDKAFGTTVATDIVYKSGNSSMIAEYNKRLAQLYAKRNKTSVNGALRENLALELRTDLMCSSIEQEKFDTFVEVIKPYIKEQMQAIVESLDPDMIGYFNYLLYNPVLSGRDKIRLDTLKIFLDPNYESSGDIEIE